MVYQTFMSLTGIYPMQLIVSMHAISVLSKNDFIRGGSSVSPASNKFKYYIHSYKISLSYWSNGTRDSFIHVLLWLI